MAEGDARRDTRRRLTADFAAWLRQARMLPERFFRDGLVVLDANVLLDLYRMTPDARNQVLDALAQVSDRLWVPHQAAVEFSRNRQQVVVDRLSSIKKCRQVLQLAAVNAVDVLESAIAQLEHLRDRTGTTRTWSVDAADLDRGSLRARLAGVMDPALAELAALEEEHDLHPRDMQQVDPLLSQIDELLAGRIGASYPASRFRALVEEAHTFRFPNKIPPGFRDVAEKETQVGAAGDFILWQQTIDRARSIPGDDRLVLLITKDVKADWWLLDAKKRPRGPLPELVQELRDQARADLLLLSLKDFLSGTKAHLSFTVSDHTLEELSEISDGADALLPEAFRNPASAPNLLDLSPRDFERLIHYLLIQMGYQVADVYEHLDSGCDLVLIDERGPNPREIVVEVKRYRSPTPAEPIFRLMYTLRKRRASSALLITTSSFTNKARKLAQDEPVELIDGRSLLRLLAEHGISARIQFEDGEDADGSSHRD